MWDCSAVTPPRSQETNPSQINVFPVAIQDAVTPALGEGLPPASSQAAARFAPLLASRKHGIIGNGSKR